MKKGKIMLAALGLTLAMSSHRPGGVEYWERHRQRALVV